MSTEKIAVDQNNKINLTFCKEEKDGIELYAFCGDDKNPVNNGEQVNVILKKTGENVEKTYRNLDELRGKISRVTPVLNNGSNVTSAAAPAAAPIAETVAAETVAPIAEPAAEPIAAPAAETVAEPVTVAKDNTGSEQGSSSIEGDIKVETREKDSDDDTDDDTDINRIEPSTSEQSEAEAEDKGIDVTPEKNASTSSEQEDVDAANALLSLNEQSSKDMSSLPSTKQESKLTPEMRERFLKRIDAIKKQHSIGGNSKTKKQRKNQKRKTKRVRFTKRNYARNRRQTKRK